MNKLFQNLSNKEIDKLLKLLESTTLSYKKNSNIILDSKDNVIGVMLEGKIQIVNIDYNGNKTIVEELNKDNIFGTIISSLNSIDTSIEVLEDTKLLFIEYDLILKSDSNIPYYNKFIKNLLDITNEIIKEKNNRIQILTKKTIRDKILEYFLLNVNKSSRIVELKNNYTQLADYLAINRSAMQRELKNLKEEGLIETKDKKIYLKY